jgi:hypothetical protein
MTTVTICPAEWADITPLARLAAAAWPAATANAAGREGCPPSPGHGHGDVVAAAR